MLVFQTNPVEFNFFFYVNSLFCSDKFACMVAAGYWGERRRVCLFLTEKKTAVKLLTCIDEFLKLIRDETTKLI